jgi:plastocyanin
LKTLRLIAVLTLAAGPAIAGNLTVGVTDRKGNALADVIVYLMPKNVAATGIERSEAPLGATIEQVNNMFVPHMLVVETGTQVSFPNHDSVSHHVYSFSEAKTFQLDLYRGNKYPPQLFDKPGLIVLGCNIHDSMLGYILVVDTPWSAITSQAGIAAIARLPAGEYELFVWTPRARARDLPAAVQLDIGETGDASIAIQLTGKLSPPHSGAAGSLNWENY